VRLDLRYLGASGLKTTSGGAQALAFAPNLARPKVFFDADLVHPVRYREAMSALHDVVVGDLRFKKKDRSAYEAWKAEQLREQQALRAQLSDRAVKRELEKLRAEPIPADLDRQFQDAHRLYWQKRVAWANELARNDPELFRALVPCDPVVTVAPDTVFFECFSKDESAYGCLSVSRDAFRAEAGAGLGTTNVDYSLALFDHFQSLRSYRSTRLLVDPTGFEVRTEGHGDLREEKIDLPPSWLRGFGQLQAAMALPSRTVVLSVDVVYSILAHLRRHREKTGPRSLRFRLEPGRPPIVVIEPWGIELASRGPVYDGPTREDIRVWGRRRLFALARTLPLAEAFEVRLFGTGLPSVWTARLGEMRFTLALSGWTTNDWTSASALETLVSETTPDRALVERALAHLQATHVDTPSNLAKTLGASEAAIEAALLALARRGQVVVDFAHSVVRYRSILPVALSETLLGSESPEVKEGRALAASVQFARREVQAGGMLVLARFGSMEVEAIIDLDGKIQRASCNCSHFFKNRLRKGPCRHLLAMRLALFAGAPEQHAPPPVVGSKPADLIMQVQLFTKETIRFLEGLAAQRGLAFDELLVRAWKIARPEIAALATSPPLPELSDTISRMVHLPRGLAEEVHKEESRLRAPFPWGRLLGWAVWQMRNALKFSISVGP
jgi:hypothetical protein